MPAQPIRLSSMQFDKKGDAVAYLQNMLRGYDVGDRVRADDALILRAALERHPQAATKIGCGITDFSVRSADYGTKCFWLNRPDGTTQKFSITGSIYGAKL